MTFSSMVLHPIEGVVITVFCIFVTPVVNIFLVQPQPRKWGAPPGGGRSDRENAPASGDGRNFGGFSPGLRTVNV